MIEFDRVTKRYADGSPAVADVSFTVPSHKTVVLVGSSGSGKTTLLRMVNRMVDPTSGRVLIDDVDVTTMDPVRLRRSIGYVLQSGGLLPHRTVVENIAIVPRLNGATRPDARERALTMLDTVGLDRDLASRFPAQLSGGQQQRVGVARALASDPNILLMDEPFGAVDPIVRRSLQHELRELQRTLGKTILFVTHDIDEALALADEIIIVAAHGAIAQRGTPTEILTRPANAFVAEFVGVDRPERRLRLADAAGVEVVTDASGRPIGTLER
ncbi:ATP-binding cassette domain-containing protein [Labedella populi]|uniref:ABC-type quaternary amine transporter n=1 Tax=Labedella populi TaxID=2498850 RepID=A0A444Q6F5_9MICO|nr:ATP-binding cassette domain-containing protein [Labedella populi]RWZ59482.1 ATP-binding cassette domain-containing protein [Labedella populi]